MKYCFYYQLAITLLTKQLGQFKYQYYPKYKTKNYEHWPQVLKTKKNTSKNILYTKYISEWKNLAKTVHETCKLNFLAYKTYIFLILKYLFKKILIHVYKLK